MAIRLRSDQQRGRPKRHCMVVHAYYPLGETRVEREAQALVDKGYALDVVCLRADGEPAAERLQGVDVHRLPVKRHKQYGVVVQFLEYAAFLVLAGLKLVALHARHRYRVIQVHNLPDFLVFAALVPKIGGARIILDLHDLMPEFYAARFQRDLSSWPVRLVRWQEAVSCRFADHVITVTEAWRQALVQRGVAPERISVVMNVADDRIFNQDSTSTIPVTDREGLHLLYHGSLTPRYGLDLAIQAVDIVRRSVPAVRLTIHGQGTHVETLRNLADELDLNDHVRFSLQLMPTSELPSFLRRADAGLVPYRRDLFTDGILPTKLMEYVAVGLPVVAARTPAIAAYFDETMVQFFEAGDPESMAEAILALYADRERLVQLAHNSQRFLRRYNWPTISAEYVALVERLAG